MSRVGAVMVTFHPGPAVVESVRSIRTQVDLLVLVDNGSGEGELAVLRESAAETHCKVIENGSNLGIATALNRGVRWVMEQGADTVLLLDQDAQLEEGYVAAMLACLAESAGRAAIIMPRMVDARFGNPIPSPRTSTGDLEVAITSGSILPRWVFEKTGMFAEELFIDQVDSEYSLRVRSMGFTIVECSNAVLQHSPGAPTRQRFLGSKPFHVKNYSPTRRYYQSRNLIWMWRRYAGEFPVFLRDQVKSFAKELAKTAWETEKWAKLTAVFEGLRDGFRGKMGARKP